jgi:hypothetical protein
MSVCVCVCVVCEEKGKKGEMSTQAWLYIESVENKKLVSRYSILYSYLLANFGLGRAIRPEPG